MATPDENHLVNQTSLRSDARLSTMLISWGRNHWRIITRVTGIVATLTAAAWAVFSLVYQSIILPRLEPGNIQITIRAEQVGIAEKYSIHKVSFELKNVGLNRLYIPATYFLARAFNVVSEGDKLKPSRETTATNKLAGAISSVLADMTPHQRTAFRAQAANYLFIKKWEKSLPEDALIGQSDQRGLYDLDDESVVYVQLGRLTGISEMLEPGESSFAEKQIIVPKGYEVLSIQCRGFASKERMPKIVWVGAPHSGGLSLIEFSAGPGLSNSLAHFRDSVATAISNGTFSQLESNLDKSSFFFDQRIESFIQEDHERVDSVETNASVKPPIRR